MKNLLILALTVWPAMAQASEGVNQFWFGIIYIVGAILIIITICLGIANRSVKKDLKEKNGLYNYLKTKNERCDRLLEGRLEFVERQSYDDLFREHPNFLLTDLAGILSCADRDIEIVERGLLKIILSSLAENKIVRQGELIYTEAVIQIGRCEGIVFLLKHDEGVVRIKTNKRVYYLLPRLGFIIEEEVASYTKFNNLKNIYPFSGEKGKPARIDLKK